MNDLPVFEKPLGVAQFNKPPVFKTAVSLIADGTNGRIIDSLNCDFLHVESCDMPCRISFNFQGVDQSIPLVSGVEIHGNIWGVILWHDNYAGFTGSRPQVQFNLATGSKITVNNLGGRVLLHGPVSASSSASGFTATVPVPYGYKYLAVNGLWTVNAVSAPSSVTYTAQFTDANGTNIFPAAIVRGGVNFNSIANVFQGMLTPQLVNTGVYGYAFDIEVPIPTLAERLIISGALAPAATSSATFGASWSAR